MIPFLRGRRPLVVMYLRGQDVPQKVRGGGALASSRVRDRPPSGPVLPRVSPNLAVQLRIPGTSFTLLALTTLPVSVSTSA